VKRLLATVLLVTALALPGGAVLAQGGTGDLEVQIVQGPALVTPPTTQGEVRLRITNHGPDAIGFAPSGPDTGITLTIEHIPYYELYGAAFIVEGLSGDAVSSEFGVTDLPPYEPTALYRFRFRVLDPGDSAELTVQYGINYLAEELVPDGRFTLRVRTGVIWDVDPNMDNNVTFMTFNLVPPIPVPTLDAVGLAVFALALVGAFFLLRRAKTPEDQAEMGR
jgi:hypothetical protein